MNNNASGKRSSLLDFLQTTAGKVTAFLSFVTAVFTALKLLSGDTKLTIILLLAIIICTFWIMALYCFFKKVEILNTTFPRGTQTSKQPAYSVFTRRIALLITITIPILCVLGIVYFKLGIKDTNNGLTLILGEKVDIEGYVVTASGELADNAFVTLYIGQAKRTGVAPGGKFIFKDVDLTNEAMKTVQIEAQWRNLVSPIEQLDLSKGSPKDLQIKLPTGKPPFRIDYYDVEGLAIQFVADGKLDKQWEDKLGGQHPIAGNNVFRTLKDLMRRFSGPPYGDFFEPNGTRVPQNRYIRPRIPKHTSKFFFAEGERGLDMWAGYSREEFLSVFNSNSKWHLNINYRRPRRRSTRNNNTERQSISSSDLSSDYFRFWKFANIDDVRKQEPKFETDHIYSFYAYIIEDYLPPDFFVMLLTSTKPSGCGYGGTIVTLVPRSLKLRIAVLENISDYPIRLGAFSLKQNNFTKLRSFNDDQAQLQSKLLEQEPLFTREMLNPKEKFIIPLEMRFSYTDEQRSQLREFTETPKEFMNILEEAAEFEFPMSNEEKLNIGSSELLKLLKRPAEDLQLEKVFSYGPSIRIENVEVDGMNYPFRINSNNYFIVQAGFSGGSCPYVYTYNHEINSWLNEGTFLYSVIGKSNKTTDEKELLRFDGRVLIKERDRETSFIDSVYIKAVASDGSATILYPKNSKLRFTDGRNLVLNQGQQVQIDFEMPDGLIQQKYIFVATGYYVPY